MMLRQRARGLSVIHCAWQIAIAQGLFLAWSCLPFSLVLDRRWAYFSNYTVYAVLVAIALAADGLRVISKQLPLLGTSFYEIVGRSARQTTTVLVLLLLYLVASKDQIVSRLFLFTFI